MKNPNKIITQDFYFKAKRFPFLSGIGSILDIGCSYDMNIDKIYNQTVSQALNGDWQSVKNDFSVAFKVQE